MLPPVTRENIITGVATCDLYPGAQHGQSGQCPSCHDTVGAVLSRDQVIVIRDAGTKMFGSTSLLKTVYRVWCWCWLMVDIEYRDS